MRKEAKLYPSEKNYILQYEKAEISHFLVPEPEMISIFFLKKKKSVPILCNLNPQ
jgi:hypothetical protein